MDPKRLTETSRFLSYVLRHEPHSIGLHLDSEGWADIGQLIAGAAKGGRILDTTLIGAVVSTNGKQRFSLSDDGLRIRAVQGHSTSAVSLQYSEKEPPDLLYHGTATRFLDSILRQGLIPGSRHHVHLSQDIATAIAVGQRHGKPAVLIIDALRMHRQGCAFFQAENGVWLTAHVPTDFLQQQDAL